MQRFSGILILLTFLLCGTVGTVIAADTAADFYKGKTVEYVIPYGVGGGTDQLSRTLIPYLEKRLGASLVPSNKAGAGGLIGLNYLWNSRKNGLVMGTVMYDAAVWEEFVGGKTINFKVDDLTMVGGIEKQAIILVTDPKGPYKTLTDLINSPRPVKMAVPGKMGTFHIMMALASDVWGIKIDFIPGYNGAAAMMKAVEGGEVDMTCGSEVSATPRIKSGTVHPVVYLSREREPFLPDIPAIMETPAKDAKALARFDSAIWVMQYARSLGMPAGVPQDRVEFVRNALKDTLKDPVLLEEGKKMGIPYIFTDPAEFKKQKEKLFGGMSEQERQHLINLLK